MSSEHTNITSHRKRQRPVIIATIVASSIMLSFGIGYRVLAARLAAPVDTIPLSQEELDRLPLQIGDWTGQDVPLDEAIVRATDTDAHVNRSYSRQNSPESVGLYIAYGVKVRDLAPHRPEVCYTGGGWTLTDRRSTDLSLSNEMKLPCNVLQFSRGSLNKQGVVVLDYYIVDGQYCRDVSALRFKAWRGSGAIGYVAQVQIVASVAPNLPAESAARVVSAFAAESASAISSLFESQGEEGTDGEKIGGEEGKKIGREEDKKIGSEEGR
jgi:EpsI family protein